jgi:AcrR family transcriptional regulator
MPPTPARILRAIAESLPNGQHKPAPRDLEWQTKILAAAEAMFIQLGFAAVTMAQFATSLRTTPTTIRRHFCDLDAILAEILHRHLQAIAKAIGDIPANTPNRHAAARAAYLAATRTPYNAPTGRHLLLLRDRHALPPDMAASVENLRASIGALIAADHSEAALTLLDSPAFHLSEVEALLASRAASAAQPSTSPPDRPETSPPGEKPARALPAPGAPIHPKPQPPSLRSLHRSTSLSPPAHPLHPLSKELAMRARAGPPTG